MSKIVRRSIVFACALGFVGALSVQHLGAQAGKEPKAPIVLTGAPMGGVKFDHTAHMKTGAKCETCHHASKPEKAKTSDYQKCTDCHTKTATPPMKTKTQAAFHDPMAKKGLCVDCHVEQNAKGKKAPTACNGCHKKENA
jgi:hypothetical protein